MTRREEYRKTANYRFLESVLVRSLTIGEVWFWAWIFNPSLNSNTVWFIAVICSMLVISMVAAVTGNKYEGRN